MLILAPSPLAIHFDSSFLRRRSVQSASKFDLGLDQESPPPRTFTPVAPDSTSTHQSSQASSGATTENLPPLTAANLALRSKLRSSSLAASSTPTSRHPSNRSQNPSRGIGDQQAPTSFPLAPRSPSTSEATIFEVEDRAESPSASRRPQRPKIRRGLV